MIVAAASALAANAAADALAAASASKILPPPPAPPTYPKAQSSCLASAWEYLSTAESLKGTHGSWNRPLQIVNASFGKDGFGPFVTMEGIGMPKPYIHDAVSTQILTAGSWEVRDVEDVARAANVSLPPADKAAFVDVGAQLGYYSIAFARRGFLVYAIEPMLHHTLALEATRCLHSPGAGDLITVLQTAVVGPSQAEQMSCSLLSPFRANDHGTAELLCVNGTGKAVCPGMSVDGGINHTFYHHYRRFCQSLPAPLQTLDGLLLEPAVLGTLRGRHLVVKIDTTGSECDVLAGGTKALFHKLRPTLMLINVDSKRSDECVRGLATTHGYTLHPMAISPGSTHSKAAWRHAQHVVLSDARQQRSL